MRPLKKTKFSFLFFFLFVCLFVLNFCLFRAIPVAYASSQTRGPIRAAAASLHHRHSKKGSEPRLQPTPRLTATPDPLPTEWGHGLNPCPHGYQLDLLPLSHNGNSKAEFFKLSSLLSFMHMLTSYYTENCPWFITHKYPQIFYLVVLQN